MRTHLHSRKFFDTSSKSNIDLSGFVKVKKITQIVTDGNNTITHNLGVFIDSFSIKDGNDFYFTTMTGDIDINNFNIRFRLLGVSTLNVTIFLYYR